jgi:hypothetical protein
VIDIIDAIGVHLTALWILDNFLINYVSGVLFWVTMNYFSRLNSDDFAKLLKRRLFDVYHGFVLTL